MFSPSDSNLIVLRTTYGILISHDNGNSWRFACEDALGLPNSNAPLDPSLGLTATNALVAGVTNDLHEGAPYLGLDVSPDLACSWNCIGGPLAGQAVTDVVVRPDAPDFVLAVTSTYGLLDGGGASSQVFESTDDGATWDPIGVPLDPFVLIHTIDVAKTDPTRIYLSGTRGVGPQTKASLFVSVNKGTDWTEHPIPQFDPMQEQFVWIAAVDPMQPDRVYVRSSAPLNPGGLSRLYVTTDMGTTFQKVLEFKVPPAMVARSGIGELLGFALSPDGSKIYAGSKESGLFIAARSDLNFQMVNSSPHAAGEPLRVQCLATRGNELWACSEAVSGFVIGVSTDDGAHFCPKMRQVTSVNGLIDCSCSSDASASSTTGGGCGATIKGSQCKAAFDMFCAPQVNPCQPDPPASLPAECRVSAADAGAKCSSGPTTKSSACGCSTPGGRAGSGRIACAAVFALAWRRRRARSSLLSLSVVCFLFVFFRGLFPIGCSRALDLG